LEREGSKRVRVSLGKTLAGLSLCLGLVVAVRAAEMVKVGQKAPAWSGKTLAGKAIKAADLKGKVVLFNFFSYY